MISKVVVQLLKKLIPVVLTVAFIVWLYVSYGAWTYTLQNFAEFIRLVVEHMELVIISMLAAVLIGVTLGTLMTRPGMEKGADVIMAVVNIWQSVPSLGVIALAYAILPVIGISGIGMVPALLALFCTGISPIVRNTYAGIDGISKDIIETATGMGMTKKQILFQVELPNAMPVIMGGIRTSSAIIVGTAPLAFLIGGGGLGFWIFTGIALVNLGIMTAGAVPVALLAMGVDYALGILEKSIVSRGIQSGDLKAI